MSNLRLSSWTVVASESAGPDKRAPEAMRYTVTLDYGDRQVTLAGSDLAESAEFAALREWVRAQAATKSARG